MSHYLNGTHVLGATVIPKAKAPTPVKTKPVPPKAPTLPKLTATAPKALIKSAGKSLAAKLSATVPAANVKAALTALKQAAHAPATAAAAALGPRIAAAMTPAKAAALTAANAKTNTATTAANTAAASAATAAGNRAVASGNKLAARYPSGKRLVSTGQGLVAKASKAAAPAPAVHGIGIAQAGMMTATAPMINVKQLSAELTEWTTEANALAQAADIATLVAAAVAQLTTAGQVTLAQSGQTIVDRCNAVINNYNSDTGDPTVMATVAQINTDANAWQVQAAAVGTNVNLAAAGTKAGTPAVTAAIASLNSAGQAAIAAGQQLMQMAAMGGATPYGQPSPYGMLPTPMAPGTYPTAITGYMGMDPTTLSQTAQAVGQQAITLAQAGSALVANSDATSWMSQATSATQAAQSVAAACQQAYNTAAASAMAAQAAPGGYDSGGGGGGGGGDFGDDSGGGDDGGDDGLSDDDSGDGTDDGSDGSSDGSSDDSAAALEADVENADYSDDALPEDVMGSYYLTGTQCIGADVPASSTYTDSTSVLMVQKALKAKGFDPGGTDGVMGPHTAGAIKALQKSLGVDQTGVIDNGVYLWAADVVASGAAGTSTPSRSSARSAPSGGGSYASVMSPQGTLMPGTTNVPGFWSAPLWDGAPIKRWQGAVAGVGFVAIVGGIIAGVRR